MCAQWKGISSSLGLGASLASGLRSIDGSGGVLALKLRAARASFRFPKASQVGGLRGWRDWRVADVCPPST